MDAIKHHQTKQKNAHVCLRVFKNARVRFRAFLLHIFKAHPRYIAGWLWVSFFGTLCANLGGAFAPFSVAEAYRTVHKTFRTNWLHISSDSDII
mgnify:FL=1